MQTSPPFLILSGVRGDTQRYRSFHAYEQLRYAGVPCELTHLTDPRLPERFERARVVILHRVALDPYVERLMKGITDRGGLLIGDVDDLVFDPTAFTWIDSPDFQDPLRTVLYQEEMRRYRATLEACHGVTASTEYLAEQVRGLKIPVWVHRNGFSLEMLGLSEAAYLQRADHPGRVVLGYASGTRTHDRDFAVARPAIERALEQHPHTELWLVGPLDPGGDWGGLTNRIRRIKRVPWQELPEIQAGFDINLAPLVIDNPFGQSKSEIKYMEAALVRVPTAASPTGAFAHAIRPGETGFLAETEQEWFGSLSGLIEDDRLRQAVGQRAFDDVFTRYHPSSRSAELVSTLNQIHETVYQEPIWDNDGMLRLQSRLETNRIAPADSRLDRRTLRPPTISRMALYSLRHRGPRTLLLQVRVYLRRLVAPLIPYRSGGPEGS